MPSRTVLFRRTFSQYGNVHACFVIVAWQRVYFRSQEFRTLQSLLQEPALSLGLFSSGPSQMLLEFSPTVLAGSCARFSDRREWHIPDRTVFELIITVHRSRGNLQGVLAEMPRGEHRIISSPTLSLESHAVLHATCLSCVVALILMGLPSLHGDQNSIY